MKLTEFESNYIETMLWSSDDDDGKEMRSRYSIDDFSNETIQKIKKDCDEFQKICGDLIEGWDEGRIAHDFWLTRNRHGTGFWDGDYPEKLGEKLTDISHEFGEQWLYVGDDGKLYLI